MDGGGQLEKGNGETRFPPPFKLEWRIRNIDAVGWFLFG